MCVMAKIHQQSRQDEGRLSVKRDLRSVHGLRGEYLGGIFIICVEGVSCHLLKEYRVTTTFQQFSSQEAPPEKQGELAALATAFAPSLRGPKTVVLQTNGPDKDPIHGAFITARRLAYVLEHSPLAEALRHDVPRLFERVELTCDLRPIHSAIRLSQADKTIYVHKPTFVPSLAEVEDHAVKAFGHFLYSRHPDSFRRRFDLNCGSAPYHAELFARMFAAWTRYFVHADRRELDTTQMIGTRREAAERNTIVMDEVRRYINP